MAPSTSRQVLVWSIPTLAFLLSLLWYRRKRSASLRSDPGGKRQDIANKTKDSSSSSDNQCVSVSTENSEEHTVKVVISENNLIDDPIQTVERESESNKSSETVLKEEVKSISLPSVNKGVSVVTNGTCDLETCKDIEVFEEVCVKTQQLDLEQDISVKSGAEESEITFIDSDYECLENPKYFIDKINTAVSPTDEIYTCEENNKIAFGIVVTDSSVEKSLNSCALDTVNPNSTEIVEATNNTELSVGSQISNDQQTLEGSSECCSESDKVSEDLKQSNSIENNTELGFLVKSEEETVEEEVSVTCVSSTEVVMARKSSKEASSLEKQSHEDENKKLGAEAAMQSNESVSLEHKLSSLEIDGNVTAKASSNVECSANGAVAASAEHHGTERDSANHSPADVMLASPSISSYSDVQSEGSSDSGKGCSDVATPPSRTPASGSSLSGDVPVPSVYEFVLPQHLVGRLIGRHGCFVHQIKAKTNANILIKRHPDTHKLKICAVEGTQADIDNALEMIRQKFPEKRYPSVTLEQVCFLPPVPTFPLIPEFLQLQLVEGVNNDVILSSLVNTAHFFLQQPTHPTFPALNRLNACMNMCYSEPSAPLLPMPTEAGVICVAPAMGGWYRAQIVAVDSESETCDIKYVDYGGYMTVDSSVLRQIRSDFMTLPFQASECYLANVSPVGGEEWSKESYSGMEELTHGQVLQAQICTYSEDGLPIVYLYAIHNSQVVLVNEELVSRGLAEWIEPQKT